MVIALCSCSAKPGENVYNDFVVLEVEKDKNIGDNYLCYNKETKIMYYVTYHGGISPCYIFDDETNECHIGHYPEDWNE